MHLIKTYQKESDEEEFQKLLGPISSITSQHELFALVKCRPLLDGIPSIDQPEFKKASAVKLEEGARVLGVMVNGVAKAYPISIMNYHEIVNDEFAGQPVVVTYCPLCGSGIAFDAAIDGQAKTFGVSGLLYNSDVLLYDRQTQSLWSQIMMQAVTGPMAGKELQMLPTMNTSWGEWKAVFKCKRIIKVSSSLTESKKSITA